MGDLHLSHYRKLMVLLFTAAIMYTLHIYGIGAASLVEFGLDVTGVAGTVVDFILIVGLPAVFNMAQPNEEGESIFAYWRWVAVGLVVVVLLVAIAVMWP
jgi:hypothetical protein